MLFDVGDVKNATQIHDAHIMMLRNSWGYMLAMYDAQLNTPDALLGNPNLQTLSTLY